MTHEAFVAGLVWVLQLGCATKVARVLQSYNKSHNKNLNRDQLHFSAACCGNAER